jgi:hypothetical protein
MVSDIYEGNPGSFVIITSPAAKYNLSTGAPHFRQQNSLIREFPTEDGVHMFQKGLIFALHGLPQISLWSKQSRNFQAEINL